MNKFIARTKEKIASDKKAIMALRVECPEMTIVEIASQIGISYSIAYSVIRKAARVKNVALKKT